MSESLITELLHKIGRSLYADTTSCKKYSVHSPTLPDSTTNIKEAVVPVIIKNLISSLRHKHYDSKYDNRNKSNAESTRLREEGNKQFVGSKSDYNSLIKALELYTKSIAHAMPGSEEISLAHANRAAVLLSLDLPEESLVDIERAIEFGYPEKSKPKLLIRRAECYTKLATTSITESKIWLKKAALKKRTKKELSEICKDYPSTLKDADILDEEGLIPKVKSPSKRFPCASDAVDIEYSSLNGIPDRRIVATRDIDIGEVLIVEKHYFKCLKEDMLYTHCSYCMDFAWTGLPCDDCKNVIYCSESCRADAWTEYHQVECLVFGLLNQKQFSRMTVHCVRLLIQMLLEAGGLQQLKKRVEEFNAFTSEFLIIQFIKEE